MTYRRVALLESTLLLSAAPVVARSSPEDSGTGGAQLTVSASAFQPSGTIPREQSEYGLGISPAPSWTTVPGAASYAIVVEDPDGSTKSVVHRVAWNVPTATTRLPAGLRERDRLSGTPLEGIMQGATGLFRSAGNTMLA